MWRWMCQKYLKLLSVVAHPQAEIKPDLSLKSIRLIVISYDDVKTLNNNWNAKINICTIILAFDFVMCKLSTLQWYDYIPIHLPLKESLIYFNISIFLLHLCKNIRNYLGSHIYTLLAIQQDIEFTLMYKIQCQFIWLKVSQFIYAV